jgi:hypothetical protein
LKALWALAGLCERAAHRHADGNGVCALPGEPAFLWIYAGDAGADDLWDDAGYLPGDDPCLCWALF